MRKFILTAAIPEKKDLFQMSEYKPVIQLYCESFKNLRETILAIKPIGYRAPSMRRFRKLLKCIGELELLHPLFLIRMYKIQELKTAPEIAGEIDFITTKGAQLTLRRVKPNQVELTQHNQLLKQA